MLCPVLTLLLSFSAGSLIIVSLKVQEFLLKTQNESFVVQKKFSLCLSVLHQFCRRLRVIKRIFSKAYTYKNLNYSKISEGKKLVPDNHLKRQFSTYVDGLKKYRMLWKLKQLNVQMIFLSRRFFIFLRGSFNKFGEWKVFRCLLVFFCFVFHNVGAKSSTQNGNFFTWVLPIAFKFKTMFVHLLRELEKA